MSIVAAPVRPLTIEEWYEHYHEYEGGRCELVRGRAIMTPTEATHNNRVIIRLAVLLDPLLGGPWEPMSNTSVVLADEPVPTIRVPDLAVVRSASVGPDWRMRPTDVALVVEVVSPSSVETDWVTKREEYAAAGIPNYLIVDVRGKDPQVWLFDRLSSGPDGRTTYDVRRPHRGRHLGNSAPAGVRPDHDPRRRPDLTRVHPHPGAERRVSTGKRQARRRGQSAA